MTCFFCRGNAEQTTTEYIEKIDNFVVVIKKCTLRKMYTMRRRIFF